MSPAELVVVSQRSLVLPSFLLCLAAMGGSLEAQCATQWLPGNGIEGTDGPVHAMTSWDPDGAGPLAPRLVLGGDFHLAGTIAARRLVMWDRATDVWTDLGGADGTIWALATSPAGEIIAAGGFAEIGGVAANHIARWNGSTWSPLGAGLGAPGYNVRSLTFLPNGSLVAGGDFDFGGLSGIAAWDGVSWSSLGSGIGGSSSFTVDALATLANGDVVAGGSFSSAGGLPVGNLALWNGVSWSAIGSANDAVRGLAVRQNGHLVAVGRFTSIGGVIVSRVARWNGLVWQAMGVTSGFLEAVTVLGNGEVLAGGEVAFPTGSAHASVAKWTGSSWSPLVGLTSPVVSLAVLPGGDFVAGASFASSNENVRRWTAGSGWQPLRVVAAASPLAFLARSNGELVASGSFTNPANPGQLLKGVARWTGSSWSLLGGPANDRVDALTEASNGDLLAGGSFTSIGGVPANAVARWNGAVWSPLGTGPAGAVRALTTTSNGDVVAGGTINTAGGQNVARWNGANWQAMSTGLYQSDPIANPVAFVDQLVTLPTGHVIASGSFDRADGQPVGNIARWDGTSWAPLPGLQYGGTIHTLSALPNGDLLVGGTFPTGNGIARWNGTSVASVGNGVTFLGQPGTVYALQPLPNGDLLVGGSFDSAGGSPAAFVARWNGAVWSPVAAGTDGPVERLAFARNGEVFVGGSFTAAGGHPSPGLARLGTTCPATASAYGMGCPSSGGSNNLVANTAPWVDAAFRSTGSGLPTVALVAVLTSVTPIAQGAAPLASIFAQGVPGCDILVVPDILQALATTTGAAQTELFLPNAPPLVGVTFYQQMVPIEVDASSSVVAITATNALLLTAGMF